MRGVDLFPSTNLSCSRETTRRGVIEEAAKEGGRRVTTYAATIRRRGEWCTRSNDSEEDARFERASEAVPLETPQSRGREAASLGCD